MGFTRKSRSVKIGGFAHVEPVFLGGGFPVVVQTMWKSRLSFSDLPNTVKRIGQLKKLGCGVLRAA